jgi:hypothetical protein
MAGWPQTRRAPDGQAGGMTAITSTEGSGPVAGTAGAASRRPTGTAGPAIQVAGLRKKFGRVAAVDDVSFTVSYGRITGFLGPNGAGKTTTLRMILGLIRPDAGTAVIAGKPYAKLANPARTVGALLDAAAAHPGRSGRDHLRECSPPRPEYPASGPGSCWSGQAWPTRPGSGPGATRWACSRTAIAITRQCLPRSTVLPARFLRETLPPPRGSWTSAGTWLGSNR